MSRRHPIMSPSPSMLLDEDLRSKCEQLQQSLSEERTYSRQLREANDMLQAAVNELCDRYKSLSVQCAARIKELEEERSGSAADDSASQSAAANFAAEKALQLERENHELRTQVADLEHQLQDQLDALRDVYRRTGVPPQMVQAFSQTESSYVSDLRRSAAMIDYRDQNRPQGADGEASLLASFGSIEPIKAAVKELQQIKIQRVPELPTLPNLRLVSSVDPDSSPTLRLMRAMHFATKSGDGGDKGSGEVSVEDVLYNARKEIQPQAGLSTPTRGQEEHDEDTERKNALARLERLVSNACLFNQQLIDRSDRPAVFYEFMNTPSRRMKKSELALLAIADETSQRRTAT